MEAPKWRVATASVYHEATVRLYRVRPLMPRLLFTAVLVLSALYADAARAGEPQIRVSADGRVRSIPLEQYVLGVLSKEIYPGWPLESLKAQAVVSRTYAVTKMREARAEGKGYDVGSDTSHQVWEAVDLPADAPIRRAVEETRSIGVCYEGDPIEAVFFSTCGGHTESAEAIWSKAVAYLQRVRCRYCTESPNFFWTLSYTHEELLGKLARFGVRGAHIASVVTSGREGSSRVDELRLQTDAGDYKISGKDLRGALGAVNLKSLTFDVRLSEDAVKFLGSGAGHGVGMCQWGARGMALEGSAYPEILAFYYPGTARCRLYE